MMPSLEFEKEPYNANELGNMHARFRARGFVVLPRVFVRDSVDAFLAEVESVLKKDERGNWYLPDDRPEMVWPIRAPRLRAAFTCPSLAGHNRDRRRIVFWWCLGCRKCDERVG